MEAQRGKTVWRGELEGALGKDGGSRVAVEGGEGRSVEGQPEGTELDNREWKESCVWREWPLSAPRSSGQGDSGQVGGKGGSGGGGEDRGAWWCLGARGGEIALEALPTFSVPFPQVWLNSGSTASQARRWPSRS